MQFRVMGRDEIMERRKEEQVVLAALLAARQRNDEEHHAYTRHADENVASCNMPSIAQVQPMLHSNVPGSHCKTHWQILTAHLKSDPNNNRADSVQYMGGYAAATYTARQNQTRPAASAWLLETFLQHAAVQLLQPDSCFLPPEASSNSSSSLCANLGSAPSCGRRSPAQHGTWSQAYASTHAGLQLPVNQSHQEALATVLQPQSELQGLGQCSPMQSQGGSKCTSARPTHLRSGLHQHKPPGALHRVAQNQTPCSSHGLCLQASPSSAACMSPAMGSDFRCSTRMASVHLTTPPSPSPPPLSLHFPTGNHDSSITQCTTHTTSPEFDNTPHNPLHCLSTQEELHTETDTDIRDIQAYVGAPSTFHHEQRSPFETPFTTPPASIAACGGFAADHEGTVAHASHAHAAPQESENIHSQVGPLNRGVHERSESLQCPPSPLEDDTNGGKGPNWTLREMLGSWVRPGVAHCEQRHRLQDESSTRDTTAAHDMRSDRLNSVPDTLQPETSALPARFESQMVHLSRHSGDTQDEDEEVPQANAAVEGNVSEAAVTVNSSDTAHLGASHVNRITPLSREDVGAASAPYVASSAALADQHRMDAVSSAVLARTGSAATVAEAAATLIRSDRRLPSGSMRWGHLLERELEVVMQHSGVRVRDMRCGFVARHAACNVGDFELIQHVRKGHIAAVIDWYWWYG